MDRHWDENTKVLVYLVQIPLENKLYGKTRMVHYSKLPNEAETSANSSQLLNTGDIKNTYSYVKPQR